jgi:hypothetical protein
LIVKRTVTRSERAVTERRALRRRLKRFYRAFSKADWAACYSLIDPRLTEQGRVNLASYSELMQAFKDVYGNVQLWCTRVSLHMDGAPKQKDARPFAYVYVIWQDDAHGFHMFRERWVRADGKWFTRVVGLVPNKQKVGAGEDSSQSRAL